MSLAHLRPDNTFGDIDVRSREFRNILNYMAGLCRRVETMQVEGMVFENSDNGILIANEGGGGGGSTTLFVRLDTFDSATNSYSGVKQKTDGAGHWEDTDPVVTIENIFEKSDFIGIELDAIVEIVPSGTTASGDPAYTFHFVHPRETFEVDLTQVGGSNGTSTTQASWTYDVKMVGTSNVIGSALAPVDKGRRWAAGSVAVATKGLAQYTAASVLELAQAYEVHGTEECT